MNIKLIGLGGIGTALLPPLGRVLNFGAYAETPHLTLIDGDAYEGKNADRQSFLDVGNKAEMSMMRIKAEFPDLAVEARPVYATDENAFLLVNRGDIVLLGVDNHISRLLISRRCEELEDVVLISGGNEVTDGNVQVFVKEGGTNITPPITYLHPEIEYPSDRNPADMSCEELAAAGSTQLLETNLMVAATMLSAFRMAVDYKEGRGKIRYSDIYLDLQTGNSRAILRTQGNK